MFEKRLYLPCIRCTSGVRPKLTNNFFDFKCDRYPQGLRLTFNRLKEKMDDPDAAVVSSAVNVICELANKKPANYLSLAPTFFRLLTNSNNNWMLIKVHIWTESTEHFQTWFSPANCGWCLKLALAVTSCSVSFFMFHAKLRWWSSWVRWYRKSHGWQESYWSHWRQSYRWNPFWPLEFMLVYGSFYRRPSPHFFSFLSSSQNTPAKSLQYECIHTVTRALPFTKR